VHRTVTYSKSSRSEAAAAVATNRALQTAYVMRLTPAAPLCDQCQGETVLVERRYEPGRGLVADRVCSRSFCGWEVAKGEIVIPEPKVPTGKGSRGLDATLAYITARFAVLNRPASILELLDPIARPNPTGKAPGCGYHAWYWHRENLYKLIEAGDLVEDQPSDGKGLMSVLYRLAPAKKGGEQ